MLTSIGACAGPSIGEWTHFDKIGQIRLKLALVEKRLSCSLHCDLHTWSICWNSSNYTWIVLFLAFVCYQQNHRHEVFTWETYIFVQWGPDIINFDKQSSDL